MAAKKPKHKVAKQRINQTERLMEEQTLLSQERTILSKERTILSFVQTGLAFIAVGVAIINVFSRSTESVIIGTALIIMGFIEVIESVRRLKKYRGRMEEIKNKLGDDSV